MKKTFHVLTLCCCVMTAGSYAAIFSDDFESGTLDKWTVEISENGRGALAEVVDQFGYHRAHLYKDGMYYSSITKIFDYRNDLAFSFDMQTQLYSEAPEPDSAWKANGGVIFYFLNGNQEELGRVYYRASTSNYEDPYWTEHSETHAFLLEEGFDSYQYHIQDILSYITIEESNLAYVKMGFMANDTGNMYNMHADTWVDNVIVIPEPATVSLLAFGGLALLRKRK